MIRQPSAETRDDNLVDANVKLLLDAIPSYFLQSIQNSELLSRGWVFQEIRLTPANLFCAEDQTWWCCLEATGCETRPDFGEDKFAKYFSNHLQDQQRFLTMSHEPIYVMKEWLTLLGLYSLTSVSMQADRLVALTGLAQRLKELYAEPFQNSVYHSGIWSTDIPRQLLWKRDTGEDFPERRFRSTTHPIPSWSPFSCDGKITNGFGPQRGWGFLPVKLIGASTPDDFGRARNENECMLHLSGVLVPMDVVTDHSHSDTYGNTITKAHPRGYADVVVVICWDSMEDMETSEAASATEHPIDHRALLCVHDPEELVLACGILLRPRSVDNQQISPTQNWVRCGYFEQLGPGEEGFEYVSERRINTAFSVGSYGQGHQEETLENEAEIRREHPQVQDVFIY